MTRRRTGTVAEAYRGLWLVLSTSVRVSPALSVQSLAETVAQVLRGAVPLFIGLFAAGAVDRDQTQMQLAGAALVASTAVTSLLNTIGTHARVALMERVGFALDVEIARMTAQIPTLDHLESPEYLDRLQMLRDDDGSLGGALNMLLNYVNMLVFAASTLVVAATADWRLLILAAMGAPRVVGARWSMRWGREAEETSAAPGRLTRHLLDLTTSVSAAGEIRVFGLRAQLRDRVHGAVAAWRAPGVLTTAKDAALTAVVSGVLFFGSAVVVLAWITGDVLAGTVSVQALVVAVSVVSALENVSTVVAYAVQGVGRIVRNTSRFLWLRTYAESVADLHRGQLAPPERLQSGIRLEGAGFRYSGADRDALSDVTLDLPAGAVIAIVGENGAGKSTLVKLLAGLYRPSQGRIRIDGRDLSEYDLMAWRAAMSGAFADHVAFEFTLREVVGVGDVERLADDARIRHALRDGIADDLPSAVPGGLDGQLGSSWPGGVDLSGGQWQRLAISRAMMRHAPLLLVLDEPTAALDATTEHALFERYAASRTAGAVTLLITHRFSTVAAADQVVVLHNGRVAETGTHAELIARRGRYAELYNLQARGYQ